MSKEVKWLKLMNDIFEDEKIEYIESLPDGEMILLIWIKILCLASKSNENGNLMITSEIPYTSALMAHKFKKSNTQIEYALKVMQQLGMLEINDDIICVSNWCKYQNNDELAKIREQTRLRVAKHRENKKLSSCNDTVTLHCNENALISNIYNLESNIFNYWNDSKIMIHRELTDEMKKAINKIIKKYNEEQIKTYIDRYAEVFHDTDYWWHYKWSITDFLTRKDGISSFTDEGTKWANYCEWKSRKGTSNTNEIDELFNVFWEAYPYKSNIMGAKESFKRIANLQKEFPLIMEALERFKKSKQWTKQNGDFIPLPTSWLDQQRWKDEHIETREEKLRSLDMSDWL